MTRDEQAMAPAPEAGSCRMTKPRLVLNLLAAVALLGAIAWAVLGVTTRVEVDTGAAQKVHGHAYAVVVFPRLAALGLEFAALMPGADGKPSDEMLLEDGKPLGPLTAQIWSVASEGGGRFSRREHHLIFAASDGSDPRTNGRMYELRSTERLPPRHALVLVLGATVAGLVAWRIGRWDAARAGAWRRYRVPLIVGVVVLVPLLVMGPPVGEGVWFWLVCGGAVLAVLLFARWYVPGDVAAGSRAVLANLTVCIGALTLGAAGLEAALGWMEPPRAAWDVAADGPVRALGEAPFQVAVAEDVLRRAEVRRGLTVFPLYWGRRPAPEAGGQAFVDHDVLHRLDERRYRRAPGPFPPRRPGMFRIAVVGDSLTYGQGVAEDRIYVAHLARALGGVEVLNLGVAGAQSEDVLLTVAWALERLAPDLVVYGMCLNDFLPAGLSQSEIAGPVPLPPLFAVHAPARTRLGRLAQMGTAQAMMRAGLAEDFHGDIARHIDAFDARFRADMRAMNRLVRDAGLPPVVAVVLDQYPVRDGPGHALTRRAEASMAAAGMDVISTDGYYAAHSGKAMRVSAWEGHPDEEAHALFASLILNHLARRAGGLTGARGSER